MRVLNYNYLNSVALNAQNISVQGNQQQSNDLEANNLNYMNYQDTDNQKGHVNAEEAANFFKEIGFRLVEFLAIFGSIAAVTTLFLRSKKTRETNSFVNSRKQALCPV
ncbi:MAG TPA: hypothetical protein V6C96_03705 [Vampirovibrionales bacterium]